MPMLRLQPEFVCLTPAHRVQNWESCSLSSSRMLRLSQNGYRYDNVTFRCRYANRNEVIVQVRIHHEL